MLRAHSFEKTLVLGKVESGRRMGRQRMRWYTGWHPESMNMSLSKFWELITYREPGVVQSMGSQRVGWD